MPLKISTAVTHEWSLIKYILEMHYQYKYIVSVHMGHAFKYLLLVHRRYASQNICYCFIKDMVLKTHFVGTYGTCLSQNIYCWVHIGNAYHNIYCWYKRDMTLKIYIFVHMEIPLKISILCIYGMLLLRRYITCLTEKFHLISNK